MKKSCTIIVYHYEAIPFLRACIRKIRQYDHPEIEQHIIITEQSTEGCYNQVISEFGNSSDITIVKMADLWSGYAVDYVMRYCNIKTDYVCGIEPDVFPIHKNWLYLCITLCEEYDFKFVGGLITISTPEDKIYYYKNPFYWLSQFLRVGRTKDYMDLSMEGGFTRFHNRNTDFHNKKKMDFPMTWGNNDWSEWAKDDYYNRGSDDATVAHCWEDNHRENSKFSFGVTHILGMPGLESGYGRIVDGIVFHFGFHRTSVGLEKENGERYSMWKAKIANGCSDELIQEMIDATKPLIGETQWHNIPTIEGRSMWDGKLKKCVLVPEKLHKRINELKNGLD